MRRGLEYIFFFIFFLITPVEIAAANFYWKYCVIDRNGPVGESISLAFDKNGHPNIAYGGAEGNRSLKFARFDGTSWQIWEINRDRELAESKLALTLDKSDRPHIIYQVNGCSDLMHTWYDGNTWLRQLVDTGNYFSNCYQISIQADNNGGIHMIYSHGNGTIFNVIAYAYVDSSTKIVRNFLDNAGHSGKWNSLAFDSQGRPSTAYYVFTAADLAFGYLDDNKWQVEKIEEQTFNNLQGYYPSMKLGRDNNFYIGFQSQTLHKIRLAIGQAGAWVVEDVADLSGWHTYSTPSPLVLDSEDNPYIAFYDFRNKDLRLAYKRENVWQTEIVDSVGDVGKWASMSLTLQGMPAIAYYDSTNGYLRCAIASNEPLPDTDGDGIQDYIEENNGTNITDIDTDDDGLGDGEEDRNGNGMVDDHETDPRTADTDGDGLPDGLELGRQIGIPGAGTILGTDPRLFFGDSDPTSTTDPLNPDTDGDGLADSFEDSNKNGAIDLLETDPNNPDTDGEGLTDRLELALGSDPSDLDSDDDGLSDFEEDENGNGVVDPGETSPLKLDSDGDGLGDGLEKGVTAGVPDPDGLGRLRATDLSVFLPDADYYKNSNPLNPDTDGDGLADGEEDRNRNGAVDPGETDFGNPDSDFDGQTDGDESSFLSNPLDPDSRADLRLLYQDDFPDHTLVRWQAVDQGSLEGPSDWLVYDGCLLQTSNIWGGSSADLRADPVKPGTMMVLIPFLGTDYKVTFKMRSSDDDEIGILFRYQDPANYLRFSINREYRYARIVGMTNARASILAEQDYVYDIDVWYDITIYTIADRHQVFLGNRRIFDIIEPVLAPGRIAFYCWKNAGASFAELKIVGSGSVVDVQPGTAAGIVKEFALLEPFPNPAAGSAIVQFQTGKTVVIDQKVFDVLGRLVRDFDDRTVAAGLHPLIWDGKDDTGQVTASGIYFIVVQVQESTGSIWRGQRKILRLR